MQKITWQISKEEKKPPMAAIGAVSAVSLGVAIYFFTKDNYFATVFFGLAPLVFFVLATQGPRETYYEITEKHVKINNTEHSYKKFKYYSFVENFLVFKPKKQEPALYVPLTEDVAGKVEELMSAQMEEDEYEESLSDVINRILRLY